jgi:molybdopterin biosynthesis enzyme
VRLERIVPGRTPPAALAGAILTRDLSIAGRRVAKGTRLTPELLVAIAIEPAGPAATVLIPEPGDVHEDEAGLRLARAVSGGDPGVTLRGPAQSRVDLVAAVAGVVAVRLTALERLNRLDPLEVFTVVDGQAVEPGDLVASVKVAPHLVPETVLAAGEALARSSRVPIVRVVPYRGSRIAVVVKGDVAAGARARFEAAIRAKAEGLRASITSLEYVDDEVDAVLAALRRASARGPDGRRPDILLTAGGASTDPADPFFVALEALGGRVVRRGVPAHPGSMLWLARLGGAAVVGLPSCGAYSMATAADLLLARLAAGQPATPATVARLAHGGILARSQRFRFPAYARDLDAPDG